MLEEYKKFNVYENSHPFPSSFDNISTGFGLTKAKNYLWKQKMNKPGYNSAYTPPGTFFLKGEEVD
jgi:hypothetical protein